MPPKRRLRRTCYGWWALHCYVRLGMAGTLCTRIIRFDTFEDARLYLCGVRMKEIQ